MKKVLWLAGLLLAHSAHPQPLDSAFFTAFERKVFQSSAAADSQGVFFQLLAHDSSMTDERAAQYWLAATQVLEKLQSRKDKLSDERQFMRYFFRTVNQDLLRRYRPLLTLSDVFEKRQYDCLTGSITYAWFLEQLGYQPTVLESATHVFVLLKTPGGYYLLESTDPIGGLLERESVIERRLAYHANAEDMRGEPDHALLASYGLKHYTLEQAVSLLYYNRAVVSFNASQYVYAAQMLKKANLLNPTHRQQQLLELSVMMAQRMAGQVGYAAPVAGSLRGE